MPDSRKSAPSRSGAAKPPEPGNGACSLMPGRPRRPTAPLRKTRQTGRVWWTKAWSGAVWPIWENVLGPNRKGDPSSLLKELEQICEADRSEWPPALLRRWFEALIPWSACRDAGPVLEARWLNLTGYTLRPGYGFTVDDWRVAQAWKLKQNGVINHRNEMCRAEWWILWRRLAGGLTENQQLELANPLIRQWNTRINNPNAKTKKQNDFQFGDHESAEVWRMLGSLERLPLASRKTLGELLIRWIERKGPRISNGAAVWALGRIGARVPSYGPLDTLVDAETVEGWIERLIALPDPSHETAFALMHMARRTNDRYRDLSETVRTSVLDWMQSNSTSPRLIELVRDGGLLDAEEQDHTLAKPFRRDCICNDGQKQRMALTSALFYHLRFAPMPLQRGAAKDL